MKCEICGCDPQIIVGIPLKREGFNETYACLDCARRSGKYCLKHSVPHVGYIRNMSACQYCVTELTERNIYRAQMLSAVLEEAAPRDFGEFSETHLDWAKDEQEKDIGLVRYLAWEALCRKLTLDEVIRLIVTSESFDPIKVRDRALP